MLRKLIFPVLALGVLALVVAGCSHKTPTQPTNSGGNISQMFGGFNASNEAPGFGNPALASGAASGEQPFDDPFARSVEFDSLVNDSNSGVFALQIVWGRLRRDSTVTTVTDWSGSLAISRGIEILKKTIRFESNDSILTRTDPKVIAWVSHTTSGSDGIAAFLIVPRLLTVIDTTVVIHVDTLGDTTRTTTIDTLPAPPVTVAFTTPPFSRTFNLSDFIKLDTIFTLTDSDAVSFHALRLSRFACPRGFLAGRWTFDSTNFGTFQGTWLSPRFDLMGSFDGNFGLSDSSKMIFFGKWIDNSGLFQGLLRGTWNFIPNFHANDRAFMRAGGWFHGGIFDASANLIGAVKGRFLGAHMVDTTGGFLVGRWSITCPTVNNEDDGMEEGPDGPIDMHDGDFRGGLMHGGSGDNMGSGDHQMGGGD